MMVHTDARRSETLHAHTLASGSPRKRPTGCRTDERDDLGRERMPFDLFLDRPSDLVELMEDMFGGSELRASR